MGAWVYEPRSHHFPPFTFPTHIPVCLRPAPRLPPPMGWSSLDRRRAIDPTCAIRRHQLKTRNPSCPVPLSAVVVQIRCGKCYAEMVSTVPGRFPSCPFCHFEDTAPADVRHQSLVSLGGLPSCWLAKVVQAVQPGAKGVFDEIGVLPSTVAHCLKDDFRDFLDPQQYQKSQKHGFHYIRYSNDLRHKALEVYGAFAEQNPRARISFIDKVFQVTH